MSLDLSTYKPSPATGGDANQIANGFQAIQDAINGLAAAAPGYEYGYKQITSDVILNSTIAGAVTVVTADAVTFDGGTLVVVEFYATYVLDASSADGGYQLFLYEDGSAKGMIAEFQHGAASYIHTGPLCVRRRFTPAAGSRTYSIRGNKTAGSDVTLKASDGTAGNPSPAFVRITKV